MDKEEDSRAFENVSHEERGEQSPSIGEEGTEADRRQWEKTRDLHEESKQVTENADESNRKGEEGGMIALKADDASGASAHEGFVLRGH